MAMLEQYRDVKTKASINTPREAAEWLQKNYWERFLPTTIEFKTKDGTIKKKRVTWCNIHFTDTVQLLKLPGPFHWVDKKGNPLMFGPGTSVKGDELRANGLIDWFRKYGHGYGWIKVSRAEALLLAQKHRLVAVTYHSGSEEISGHIATLLEDGTIAQAGAGNPFIGKSIEAGFGDKPVEFWAHVE